MHVVDKIECNYYVLNSSFLAFVGLREELLRLHYTENMVEAITTMSLYYKFTTDLEMNRWNNLCNIFHSNVDCP